MEQWQQLDNQMIDVMNENLQDKINKRKQIDLPKETYQKTCKLNCTMQCKSNTCNERCPILLGKICPQCHAIWCCFEKCHLWNNKLQVCEFLNVARIKYERTVERAEYCRTEAYQRADNIYNQAITYAKKELKRELQRR